MFAYTIKGWRLPFAGDSLNHSAMLTAEQIEALAPSLNADPADPWAAFAPDSAEGRLLARRRVDLGYTTPRPEPQRIPVAPSTPPAVRIPASASTQQAFGDVMAALARDPDIGERIVTAAPDVAVSTNLGGWINRAGVFSAHDATAYDDTQRPLVWKPGTAGRHVELGISEMNLFLWLSQAGLSHELFGERLAPIGSVYDPFIARGLDALVYALYAGATFVLVGTPSGITLAPEGGAHQSMITASLGIELPRMRSYEPVFAREVAWCLLEGIRGCLDGDERFASYLKLTTRPLDQALSQPVIDRLGEDGWREAVLAGGYRLLEARSAAEPLPDDSPVVQIVAAGPIIPEAVDAVRRLHHEEVAANLIVVTSAERLASGLHGHRLDAIRRWTPDETGHLARILPVAERRAPIVTVADTASHAMASSAPRSGRRSCRWASTISASRARSPMSMPPKASTPTTSSRRRCWRWSWSTGRPRSDPRWPGRWTRDGGDRTSSDSPRSAPTGCARMPHAMVATIQADGTPQVTPNWYWWDGERFWISTLDWTVKVKNLKRDPRVTLCIEEWARRTQYVQVFGTAEVVEGDVKDTTLDLIRKYEIDRGGGAGALGGHQGGPRPHRGHAHPDAVALRRRRRTRPSTTSPATDRARRARDPPATTAQPLRHRISRGPATCWRT